MFHIPYLLLCSGAGVIAFVQSLLTRAVLLSTKHLVMKPVSLSYRDIRDMLIIGTSTTGKPVKVAD